MNTLKLGTRNTETGFRPGQTIEGAAGWSVEQAPTNAEIRLFWYTRGKGTEDVGVVDRFQFERPLAEDARTFRFVAPPAPYSYSGRLLSICWAIELVLQPGNESTRCDLVIAPQGREIQTHS